MDCLGYINPLVTYMLHAPTEGLNSEDSTMHTHTHTTHTDTHTHIHTYTHTHTFLGHQVYAYSDDEKDEVILRLVTFPRRSILDGLVQDGGEVGGTIQLHIAHSILVGIYNTLKNG